MPSLCRRAGRAADGACGRDTLVGGLRTGPVTLLAFTLVMVVLFADALPPHGEPAEVAAGFRRALAAAALLALVLTTRDLLHVCRTTTRRAERLPDADGKRPAHRILGVAVVVGPELP